MLANLAKDRLKADTANIQTALVLLGLSDFPEWRILAVSVFAAHSRKIGIASFWQFKGFTTILSVKAIRHLRQSRLPFV